jgi:F-type H+-transporting ATPase subunit alpha
MTIELETHADAWLAKARAKLDEAALGPRAEQIGRVEEVGDGIAIVSGLPNVRLDELLRFDKGQFGFVQVLERDRVGCVLLDDVDAIEAPATWCAFPWDRRCLAGSLTRSAGRSTVKVP